MPSVAESAQNDNGDFVAAVVRELSRATRRMSADGDFADFERVALRVSNEAVRRVLEQQLHELAKIDADEVEYAGALYRRHEPARVTYHSLAGSLRVERATYRRTGVRNGPTIVPVELRAGIIENATPALAFAVAQGYAKAPLRSVRQDLVAAHREPPSRATLERMAKRIGAATKQTLGRIEPRVRAAEQIPDETIGVTLGLDRTTVPMEERAEDDDQRVVVRYRMAYVGTVALTSRKGEVLRSWRYAVAAHEDPATVTKRMMSDLKNVLAHKPRAHVGIVQDGAPEMWRLMDEALAKWKPRAKRVYRAIDMYHLCERLSAALEVVYPEERDAPLRGEMLAKWKRALLEDDDAIKDISDFFEMGPRVERRRWRWRFRNAQSQGWFQKRGGYLVYLPDKPRPAAPTPLPPLRFSGKVRRALDKVLDAYLSIPRMFRYAAIAKLGLHVGSGMTEGACKSLIMARTKRSGQRWREPGIEAVLTLRSLVESDRFVAFWTRFARRYAPLSIAA